MDERRVAKRSYHFSEQGKKPKGEIRMGLERLNPLARHTNAVEGSMEVIAQSHVA